MNPRRIATVSPQRRSFLVPRLILEEKDREKRRRLPAHTKSVNILTFPAKKPNFDRSPAENIFNCQLSIFLLCDTQTLTQNEKVDNGVKFRKKRIKKSGESVEMDDNDCDDVNVSLHHEIDHPLEEPDIEEREERFCQLVEKKLAFAVRDLLWSPSMDLIAISLDESPNSLPQSPASAIFVFRVDLESNQIQRICTIKPRGKVDEACSSITAFVWQLPQGESFPPPQLSRISLLFSP